MTQFFATTWETYYTHKLYLDYINGPTEGIILSCAGFVISGIYTPEIWKIQLRQLIPWITTSSVVGQLDIADAVLIALAFFIVILGIPSSVIRSKRSIDEEKKSGYGPASVHMLEFCIFLGVEWLWYLIPNTIVTQSMTNFILFISSFGFLFSKIAVRHTQPLLSLSKDSVSFAIIPSTNPLTNISSKARHNSSPCH